MGVNSTLCSRLRSCSCLDSLSLFEFLCAYLPSFYCDSDTSQQLQYASLILFKDVEVLYQRLAILKIFIAKVNDTFSEQSIQII